MLEMTLPAPQSGCDDQMSFDLLFLNCLHPAAPRPHHAPCPHHQITNNIKSQTIHTYTPLPCYPLCSAAAAAAVLSSLLCLLCSPSIVCVRHQSESPSPSLLSLISIDRAALAPECWASLTRYTRAFHAHSSALLLSPSPIPLVVAPRLHLFSSPFFRPLPQPARCFGLLLPDAAEAGAAAVVPLAPPPDERASHRYALASADAHRPPGIGPGEKSGPG